MSLKRWILLAAAVALGCLPLRAQRVGGGSGGASGNATAIQSKPVAATAPATNEVLTWNGSAWAPAALGTGSAIWSGIANPTGNLALTMAGYTTTLTWGSASGTTALFKLTDSASDTGTGVMLRVTTAAGSTEIPVQFDANGNGVQLTAAGVLTAIGGGAINATEIQGQAVSSAAPSSSQVLTWNGSAWAAANATGGMANPMTAAGDLIVGGASGVPARLAIGANGDCLTSTGSTEAWAACASGGGSSAFSAITSGTNTAATMTVGTGASIVTSGNGTVEATSLQGNAVANAAPSAGQMLTWSGSAWAPMSGDGCKDVRNYGAVGNDTTDDTAAVQGAISAATASGGCVFFPPTGSKYLITGELVIPDDVANNPPTQNALELIGTGTSMDGSNAGGPPYGGSQLDLRSSTDPAPQQPTVMPTTGTGSLAAATYYVEVTYVDN
ncbi:MAG: glycosyl hydrolase family 28-related protein, partial [Terriglobales bacterium]